MVANQWRAPEHITIFEVGELWQSLPPDFFSHDPLIIDAAAIEEIDSAGVQWILYLLHCADQAGIRSEVTDLPDAVAEKLRVLGLTLLPAAEVSS